MANWKIQDIAPPKKLKEKAGEVLDKKEPKLSAARERKPLPGWITKVVLPVLAVLLLSFGTVHFFFAKAEITVWPQTRVIKLLEPIVAKVAGEQLNQEERIIPARRLTEEKKATRLFPASSTTVKENRARGTIRVFNTYTLSPQTLIAKTRFVSEGGKLFRTPGRITIPGAREEGGKRTPGFLDIEVVAAEPGAHYNIEPSNFSLPGLSGSPLFTAIYAESTEPMTGGSEREVPLVSQDDIEKAKESLIEELTQKAQEELLLRIPEHMVATKDSIVVEVKEADSLVKAGAELDQFNVSVSLVATAFLFAQADLNTLAGIFIQEQLREGERVAEDKTATNFQQIAVNQKEDTANLELGIDAVAYQYVDPTELKIKLRGKSQEEADGILDSYDAFLRSNISLWPFWISSVPGNVDQVAIEVVVDPHTN